VYLADVHAKSRLILETSANTPVRRQGPGRSLPGPDAGHSLHRAAGHGEYPGQKIGRLTATVTATAAANGKRQRSAAPRDTRTLQDEPKGGVRPESRKVVRRRGPTENLAYASRTRVPEPPSIPNDRHQQQPANMKLARALKPVSNA